MFLQVLAYYFIFFMYTFWIKRLACLKHILLAWVPQYWKETFRASCFFCITIVLVTNHAWRLITLPQSYLALQAKQLLTVSEQGQTLNAQLTLCKSWLKAGKQHAHPSAFKEVYGKIMWRNKGKAWELLCKTVWFSHCSGIKRWDVINHYN